MVFKDLLQASEKKKTWKHDHRLESFDPNVKVILEEYFQMSSLHVFYAIFEQWIWNFTALNISLAD